MIWVGPMGNAVNIEGKVSENRNSFTGRSGQAQDMSFTGTRVK
jgi:hypothetical protein